MDEIGLKKSLRIGFLCVALITIMVGWSGWIGMEHARKVMDGVSLQHLPSLIGLLKFDRHLNQINRLELDMVNENIPAFRQQSLHNLKQTWEDAAASSKIFDLAKKTSKESHLWQELNAAWESWKEIDQQARKLVIKGDKNSLKLAQNLINHQGKDKFNQCRGFLSVLINLNEKSIEYYQNKSLYELRLSQRITLGSMSLGAILILILGYLVSRSLQEAHDKLVTSKEWFAITLKSIGDAVITTDPQGCVTFMNPLAQSLTGWMKAEAYGKPLTEVFTIIDDDNEKIAGNFLLMHEVAMREGISYGDLVDKNGRQVSISLSYAPITNIQGITIGAVLVFHDITELRRSEAQIIYQAQLLSNVNNAVIAADNDYAITYWNRAATQLYGWEEHEVIGKKIEEVIPVRLSDTSRSRVRQEVLSQGWWNGEAFHYGRDLTEIWVDWSISTIKDASDKVIGTASIIRDITAGKRAEQALQESELQYRMLVKTLPAVVFRGYEDWGTDFFDNKIEELTGFSKKAFDSREIKWVDVIVKDDLEYVKKAFKEALKDKKSFVREYRITHKDRSIRWIQDRSQIICDDDGKVTYIIGVFFDVSQQKQVEATIKASEQRIRLLIEKSPIGIGINTLNQQVYANPALVKVFGYDGADEIVGQPVDMLYRPEDREKVNNWNHDILSEKPLQQNYEVKGLKKDGTIFDISIWPTLLDYQEQAMVLNFIIDMSAEMALRTQLLQTQKMEAMGTLAGGIAHDFNNILGVMLGYTEMALSGIPENRQLKHRLRQILKAGQRAKTLVAQILAFSRPGTQERTVVQLGSIIEEGLKMLRATLPATIEIRQNIATREDKVMGDPSEIHQVLINLCANAAYAMKENGGVLEVSLTTATSDMMNLGNQSQLSSGAFVKLSVRDTGHGMDQEIRKRIFEPFFTTKKPGEGTGMGLAVVHGIIKAHGGVIQVDSNPGQGSEFHVYLPLVEKDVPNSIMQALPITGSGEHILFVDDEESMVEMWVEILRGLGYVVTGKTDGLEALELFQDQPHTFNLVITDQTMAHMTGLRLTEKLLKIRPDIPIILCTGYSETITRDQIKVSGIKEYLMKPLSIRELSVAIWKVLHKEDEGLHV